MKKISRIILMLLKNMVSIMQFKQKKAYGVCRYYPIDKEAKELVSIFRGGHQQTLTESQIKFLNRYIEIECQTVSE